MFVVTAIQEAASPEFDSVTKSALATLRFPAYYGFGFSLVVVSLLTGLIAVRHRAGGRWRARLFLVIVLGALVTMVVDYVWIYQPLAAMIAEPNLARPASFKTYHTASKYINTGHLGLSLIAALLICWPASKKL